MQIECRARGTKAKYMWYVYILKCCDESYYTGSSNDLEGRVKAHSIGKGAEYTRLRKPVELVYFEETTDKNKAEVREIEIKKLSRTNKKKLIKWGKGVRVSLATESN